MLILPDSSLLNDGLLNAADALERYKGEKDAGLDQFRLPDQDLLTDEFIRIGIPMTHTDLIKKVLRLNKNIWTEDSINWPGGMNWYTLHGEEKVCLNAPFLKGILPEYDIIHTDDRNLPNGKTVGWRDVLSRLIANKALNKVRVDKAFGIPLPCDNSTRWHKFTRQYN